MTDKMNRNRYYHVCVAMKMLHDEFEGFQGSARYACDPGGEFRFCALHYSLLHILAKLYLIWYIAALNGPSKLLTFIALPLNHIRK